MSIQKCVRILTTAIADGESTQFTLNLVSDPYWVGIGAPAGAGGMIMNWLADPEVGPTDAIMVDGGTGANMAGTGSTVVVIDVPVRNAGDTYDVILDIIFG